jgi:hypothetical protein
VSPANFFIILLGSNKRGQRLFGYAYLYIRPDPKMLIPLIESVTGREDKPFGQYWAFTYIAANSMDKSCYQLYAALIELPLNT